MGDEADYMGDIGIVHLAEKDSGKRGDTYRGTKTKVTHKDPLDLLHTVRYGNEATGEVDQAYEDLKKVLRLRKKGM